MSTAPEPDDARTSAPARAALRCADADREVVAELLRRHAGDGRLTHDELDERLDGVYAARTFGDLEGLTADLPELEHVVDHGAIEREARGELRKHARQRIGGAAGLGAAVVVLWMLTGFGEFWPGWVIAVIGIGVGAELWPSLRPGADPVASLRRVREGQGRIGPDGEDLGARPRIGFGDRRRDRHY